MLQSATPDEQIDLATGEVFDATFTIEGETITTPVAQTVTGLDGKTYRRQKPNVPSAAAGAHEGP